jgi:hypothetical protein
VPVYIPADPFMIRLGRVRVQRQSRNLQAAIWRNPAAKIGVFPEPG